MKTLREARDWTHEKAASEMGISRSQFIKLERGERNLTERTIKLAARAFGVEHGRVLEVGRSPEPPKPPELDVSPAETADELIEAHRDNPKELLRKIEGLLGVGRVAPPASAHTEAPTRWVRVQYGGPVEAGSWRTVEDFDDLAHDDEARPANYLPADKEYPDLELYEWDVHGDSMNALKPRAILPGDKVVGIPFAAFKGNYALRDGIIVVVEQTLDGGHHRERSVKQLELYDDRIEFHPRSTNKKHKPIVVPRTVFTDPSEGDGREVNVLAVCRRIVNDLPDL